MSPIPFEIFALPDRLSAIDLQALAKRFRDFRLYALKTSPQAFAASHETESLRELQHTVERLCTPKALHLVAFAKSNTDESHSVAQPGCDHLLHARWLGMAVLLGPEDSSTSSAVSAQSDPFARMTGSSGIARHPDGANADDGVPTPILHFHLNGVFVEPKVRKAGVGRALIDTAVRAANEKAGATGSAWICTILVDSENSAARKLYERAGFIATGQAAYLIQPRALIGESEPKEHMATHMELCRGPAA